MSTPSAASPDPAPRAEATVPPAIECRGLSKTYRVGFSMMKKVQALDGLDLTVKQGEIFGFLGPNGAGKSTTIKILTRLIRPTSGEARVLGRPPGDSLASRRLGFLPENPVFYDHLTGRELLDYYARLVAVPSSERKDRVSGLLAQVGLTRAAGYQIRRYSKGMVQRLGIAQAVLQNPDLVILDEPTSGLDPTGRREVRDLIHGLRERGATVFFSTHIIPDVEAVCDRVGMLIGGKLTALGTVAELMHTEVQAIEVVVGGIGDEAIAAAVPEETTVRKVGVERVVTLPDQARVQQLLRAVFDAGGQVLRVQPHRYSLEDLFLQELRLAADRSAPER